MSALLTERQRTTLLRRASRRMPSSRRARLRRSVREPRAAQLRYTQTLLRMLARMRRIIMRRLTPVIAAFAEQEAAPKGLPRFDALETPVRILLRNLLLELGEVMPPTRMESVIARTAASTSANNLREMRRVLGINLANIPGVAVAMDQFTSRNLSLITSIPEKLVGQIGDVLDNSRGLRHEEIAELISQRLGVAESRAALIARDQVLTLNANISAMRQQAAGITHYIWTTSGDERVRDSHAELDGTRQEWANPPVVDDEQAHPGEPINCRCVAAPDTSSLFADVLT